MKKIITQYITLALVSGVLLTACKKDEDKLVATQGKVPVLTASATTFTLLQADQTNDALTLTWSKQFWNVNTANVVYSIEMIKEGASWTTPGAVVSNGELLTKKFTVGQLNTELLRFLDPETTNDVLLRVKSEVPNSAAITYSNVIKITAKTFRDIIIYEFPQALRIAGNYQGWSPGTAPKIVDKSIVAPATTGTNYEGYINFTDPSPKFKMVKGNDWPAGDFGGGAGTLTNGGSDLSITTGAGVYKLNANTVAMTWSATKINSFALTGNATPLGWPAGPGGTPGQDHDMTLDPATGNYSITLNLTVGKIKFRANDDWAINFGDNTPANFEPDYGGSDIDIAAAGNYTIKLNIGVAGNYNYTIKKN
jgi:starch-binding outer membrane protein SusE/F